MKIFINITPRASENSIQKISETEYKVKVTAPPVDGAANDALIELLADYFKVPKNSIRIVHGYASRTKMVEIE